MSAKGPAVRLLGRVLRWPAVFDQDYSRWIVQALSPAPVIVLVHRGRPTGKLYRTPVEVLVEDAERDELVVAPMFGVETDWYRNVLDGGLVEVHIRGDVGQLEWRELDEAERRSALQAYRDAHPRYSRLILWLVARVNRLREATAEAVANEFPMLALRRTQAGEA